MLTALVLLASSILLLEIFLSCIYWPIRHKTTYYEYYGKKRDFAPVFVLDPDLGYRTSPNLHIKRPVPRGLPHAPRRKVFYDVDTDRFGFRYDEVLSVPKPAGEIRIFCLGGSATFGAEVPNQWTYPEQLHRLFHDPSVKVINAGVSGYRSIHLLKYYEKIIRPLEPDVITIYEGWNDYEDFLYGYWKPYDPGGHCLLSQMKMTYSPFCASALLYVLVYLYFHFKNFNRVEMAKNDISLSVRYMRGADDPRWQTEYETNLQKLIDQTKSDGVVPALILFPSPHYENASAEAKSWADRDLNMAGRWDAFVIALRNMRRILKKLAAENNVPLIDAMTPFENHNDDYKNKFLFFVDRMHLAKEGNECIARAMYPPLKDIIRTKCRPQEGGFEQREDSLLSKRAEL